MSTARELAVAIWVSAYVISYVREPHAFVFELDALRVPRLSPFGSQRALVSRGGLPAPSQMQATNDVRRSFGSRSELGPMREVA